MGTRWFPTWSVAWAKLRSRWPARRRPILAFEWFFVTRKKTEDGALEKKLCGAASALGVTFGIHYGANSLRVAKAGSYCFMDPVLFALCLVENPFLFGKRTVVYCGPIQAQDRGETRRCIYPLKQAFRVLCADPDTRNELVSWGLAADKVVVAGEPSAWAGRLRDIFGMQKAP